MFQKIKEWPRQIRYGLKNLVLWFPVIWNDRNWDHIFIYQILRHKLHLTEQLIRNHGHHVNHIEDANKIKTCVLLLDRLIKDDYHDNVYKEHYKKWGHPEMVFTDSTDYPDCSVVNIKYPNVRSKEDREKENKSFKLNIEKEQKMKDQDLDLLFKLMRKHIQSWWDQENSEHGI